MEGWGGLDPKLVKRRNEMLDGVNSGMHLSVVVEQLAENYGVSERCLWSDWQRRGKWAPVLLGLEKYASFGDVAEVKLNSVQRAAWRIYVQSDNPSARVGALKVVLESLRFQSDLVVSKDILLRLARLEESDKK